MESGWSQSAVQNRLDLNRAQEWGYGGGVTAMVYGLGVREWISKKSLAEQHAFGLDVLKELGGEQYLPKLK